MNILVIGSGGREHALVWKLAQSKKIKKIFCAPGNAGIQAQAECVPIRATETQKLVSFALEQKIDWTVVGPEAPLAEGIVDTFKKNRLRIFGPTQAAAQLESSKIYTKEFCTRYQIPQANYKVFAKVSEAKAHVQNQPYPLVIKADGLAEGKGVVVCQNREEAIAALNSFMVEKKFGEAGQKIVIEEFLEGEEASFIAVVDGNHILPLASSKDHKRLGEGNLGPNTGGMGAYSPSPLMTAAVYEKTMEKIMIPAVRGMVTEGFPFVGFLYAGLMIVKGEPKLLEFNVRLGDPEAQVILPRLKTDLVEILEMALQGRLNEVTPSWETRVAACIVMASQGYPGEYQRGFPIQGLADAASLSDVLVFHAGTRGEKEKVVTHGGRVLGVTALGDDLTAARARAYEAVAKISWQGCCYRKDIGR